MDRFRGLLAFLLALLLHLPPLALLVRLRAASFEPPVRIEAEVRLLPPIEEAITTPAPPAPRPQIQRQAPAPRLMPHPVRPVERALPNSSPPVLTAEDERGVPSVPNHNAPPAPGDAAPVPLVSSPPPAAGPPTAATVTDADAIWGAYARGLFQHAAHHKRYPPQALQHGWEGEVRVAALFAADGRLLAVELRQSSGHAPLDAQALSMVRRALAELPPPASAPGKSITLVVPVNFHLAR